MLWAASGCAERQACAPHCAESPEVSLSPQPAVDPQVFAALYGEELAPPEVRSPPPDAERSASGIASVRLKPGTGQTHPGERDEVSYHWVAWDAAGHRLESTVERGSPERGVVGGLPAGVVQSLQSMVVGEKRRFWIPPALLPVREGTGAAPTTGNTIAEIELLALESAASDPPPAAPPDVAEPPPEAASTASGVRFVVLQTARSARRPTLSDSVKVRYTGWTRAGQMFDSSYLRGLPVTLPVSGVIEGWSEVLQLMAEGEKRRVWIPSALAYGDAPGEGRPAGALTFDVELLEVL